MGSKGWNLIAVPHANSFLLLVRPYIETLTFAPIGALVPNRGGTETLMIPGIEYNLRITDAETNEAMHVENGMWLLLNDPRDPKGLHIARQSIVPHGDSLLALGNSTVAAGPPQIPDINTLPDTGAGAPLGYTDPYLTPLPGFTKTNPNATLRNAIQGQKILETVTISVSTTPPGGIVNIPFIVKHADARHFASTYWIEQVRDAGTGTVFEQLQYSQQTDLFFLPRFDDPKQLIKWPHVNINTLVKQ
ncbi:MAG: hypothetical protein IT167_07585 [Bryobacterales bacterium]|nr:hypothetical protein [Bryobacterales bacterium]